MRSINFLLTYLLTYLLDIMTKTDSFVNMMNSITELMLYMSIGWLHGTMVERRSLTGKLFLSCA